MKITKVFYLESLELYGMCMYTLTLIPYNFIGSPRLLFEQNQTVRMNASEQVMLNCTVSSSPDPEYIWSIPDSCLSCPRSSNDSVITFATNFTDIGNHLFTCIATNNYGNITIRFTVHVICKNYMYVCWLGYMLIYVLITLILHFTAKPIMLYSTRTENTKLSINIMLTCPVQYAYPIAKVTWSIMTESSSLQLVIEKNSTGNYILHNNGSLEIYHRFIYEEDHVTAVCTAANKYGSGQTAFHIWDPDRFKQG